MSVFETAGGPAAKPFFGARWSAAGTEVFGTPHQMHGRRVRVPGRAADDGVFVEWHWDGTELVVENDRLGFHPVFYSCIGQEVWVSTSMQGVLRGNSRRELDWEALSVFFRLGQFVGDDTAIADVRLLPPNTRLVWRDGAATLIRKPEPTPAVDPRGMGFDDAVDAFIELFARAVARRLPSNERFTVPISGGRDSRHIMLELARQGIRPASCMTVKYRPPATNEDSRIGGLLADRLGIEHVQLDRPPSFFEASRKDVLLTNFCGGGHGWIQPVAEYMSGRYDLSYDGLCGDEMTMLLRAGDPRLRLFRERRFDELATLTLDSTRLYDASRGVLADELVRRMPSGMAVQRLARELERHAAAISPVASFQVRVHSRRSIASIPFAILSDVPVVHCPFIDHDLFDFLINLEHEMVAGKAIHDAVILRAYPEFADIPFEDKTLKAPWMPADRRYYRRSRLEMASYLARHRRQAAKMLRSGWLLSRTLVDAARNVAEPPWYMRTAVYAIELQALVEG